MSGTKGLRGLSAARTCISSKWTGVVGAALVWLLAACGGAEMSVGFQQSAGRAGAGAAGASGGSSSAGGSGILDPGSGKGGSAGQSNGAGGAPACASNGVVTTFVPPVLELVVDISGSMKDPAPNSTSSKWELTRSALKAAVAGMGVQTTLGVLPYPARNRACNDLLQTVPLGQLGEVASVQRTAFEAWLQDAAPNGGTPTHSALRIGAQKLAEYTGPGNKFAILLTDGQPTIDILCKVDNDGVSSEPIIEEAEAALAKGIRSFVIGSPGSEKAQKELSRIAEAGGTAKPGCNHDGPNFCHFDLTREPDLATALNRALTEISGRALSCEMAIPAPPDGQTLDYNAVNVAYTMGANPKVMVPQETGDSCSTGWRFSADRTNIVLCPALCENLKRAPEVKVAVEFGCKTIVR